LQFTFKCDKMFLALRLIKLNAYYNKVG